MRYTNGGWIRDEEPALDDRLQAWGWLRQAQSWRIACQDRARVAGERANVRGWRGQVAAMLGRVARLRLQARYQSAAALRSASAQAIREAQDKFGPLNHTIDQRPALKWIETRIRELTHFDACSR